MLEPMVAPINKVGLVLLRDVQDENPQVCLVQVKAKNPEQQHKVDFGLPKGTRQYLDPEDNTWKDARDFTLAHRYRNDLESLAETLMNEAEQEIGLPKQVYAQAPVRELGSRLFTSRSQGGASKLPHDIQWYVMEANQPMLDAMDPHPQDAHAVQWFKLSDVRAMNAEGKINPCYVDVIEEAAQKMRAQALKQTRFQEPAPPTR